MNFSNNLTLTDLYNELKIYKNQREYNFQQKIKNTNRFILRLIYNSDLKKSNHTKRTDLIEYINLEGCKNAFMIFNSYEKIAFDINLKSIELYMNDNNENKRFKKLNFKYKYD